MKRIAITGAKGFLGKYCTEYLKDRHKITALYRSDNKGQFGTVDQVDYLETDYSVQNLAHHFAGCDCVLHLAARKVAAGEPSGLHHYLDNLSVLENVIQAAQKAGITNIVTISSRCVYGTHTPHKFAETDPLTPINFYGVEKVMEEQLCTYYNHTFSQKIKILRLSQVVSDSLEDTNAFSVFIRQALSGQDITLFGTGCAVRDYIYVKDACHGIQSALLAENASGIYNLASGFGASMAEIADRIIELSHSDSKIIHLENKKEDFTRIILDAGKICRDFNFRTQYSMETMILDIIAGQSKMNQGKEGSPNE